MKRGALFALAGLTLAIGLMVVLMRQPDAALEAPRPAEVAAALPMAPQVRAPEQMRAPEEVTQQPAVTGAPVPQEPAAAPGEGRSDVFTTDSSGHLIMNEQTRLTIEKLVALNRPQALESRLQELQQTLPPPAAQQLRDLADRYRNYEAALHQVAPPNRIPGSEQEALTLLDTLHDLRVQYFGPDVAQGLFGAEEKAQRQLIELMKTQGGTGSTLQERAEKAQALYRSLAEKPPRQ